jgi:hypothetical protein
MESDKEFTRAIGLDDSYEIVVAKTRMVLSRCTHISVDLLDSSLTSQKLKHMNPHDFDIFDFFDILLDVFEEYSLTEDCFDYYYKINLFDVKFFCFSLKKGSPTTGEWVKQIIINCIPKSFIEHNKLMREI